MIGYWISFGVVALLMLLGVINLRRIALKSYKGNLTSEMKKHANFVAFKLILFYWTCDLFYMACFTQVLILKFIFGGIILVIILVNLVEAFTFPKEKRSKLEKYGMIQDLLVGIGLTIYLIFIIPDESIKQVVIPIIAALYGGLITLVGVSWTIRKADKDRKEDEIKKARPFFSYNILRKEPTLDFVVQKICISDSMEDGVFTSEVFVELENSNLSMFEIKRIHHDHKWVNVEGNKIVLPGSKCLLNFRFSDNPMHIVLEIEDILENIHYYQIKVLPLGCQSSSGKFLHTVREIDEISESIANELINEEPLRK